MKKFFIMFLAVLLGSTAINFSVSASEEKIQSDGVVTTEKSIPEIRTRNIKQNETLSSPERKEWLNETIKINENAYNQKVSSIEETYNEIIINFHVDDFVLKDQELDSNDITCTEMQVKSVEYTKPESEETNSREVLYPTKIITYVGWSDGYYTMGSKSGILSSIVNAIIAFTPISSKTVSWIIGEATGYAISSLDNGKTSKAESKNKYFYMNKVGCVNISNRWYQIAYVGSRRSFAWSWATVYTKGGQPIIKQNGPKDGNSDTNPNNYDSLEVKPHYYENAWIRQKAIDAHQTGGYFDCFAAVSTPY